VRSAEELIDSIVNSARIPSGRRRQEIQRELRAHVEDFVATGPGWVRSSDLREIRSETEPPLSAWSGTWTNGYRRITFTTPGGGQLHIAGANEWHGANDVAHDGEFEGTVAPSGKLTLFGNFLEANDNDRCGGMNVRFRGIWRRAAK